MSWWPYFRFITTMRCCCISYLIATVYLYPLILSLVNFQYRKSRTHLWSHKHNGDATLDQVTRNSGWKPSCINIFGGFTPLEERDNKLIKHKSSHASKKNKKKNAPSGFSALQMVLLKAPPGKTFPELFKFNILTHHIPPVWAKAKMFDAGVFKVEQQRRQRQR